jgi:catalase
VDAVPLKECVHDDHIQPGDLYRLMSAERQARLVENIAGSFGKVPGELWEKMAAHFRKADLAYGDGIAAKLGL